LVLGELVEELAHDALGAASGGVLVVLGLRGEEALFGVGGDVFDGCGLGCVRVLAFAGGFGVAG
jgi:hypothetical protein